MTESEDKQVSISEQIERTSVNIITFSALNEETGMPLNIPNILGGEDIISDQVAKLKVEEAFGQLNIQSVFGFEEHMFQSCLYDTFHIGEDNEDKLSPHLYLLKSHTNSVYLLNLLTTPYADLNLDSYFNEVKFMSKAFSGVFRRTGKQLDTNEIDEEKQVDICKSTVENLAGYMHYNIFTERGLRDLVRGDRQTTAMILGMIFGLKVERTEFQCMGDCGKSYLQNDTMFEGKNPLEVGCPECQGEMTYAPPIVKIENVQFVYPNGAPAVLQDKDPNGANPAKYIGYITGIAMPRNISLTVNRLSPEHFSTLGTIPAKATFGSPLDPTEFISINTNWRQNKDSVTMFVSVGNSLFMDYKKVEFIPQLTAITINREIVEGFDRGLEIDQILRKTIISDWKLTKSIPMKEIGEYDDLRNLPVKEELS